MHARGGGEANRSKAAAAFEGKCARNHAPNAGGDVLPPGPAVPPLPLTHAAHAASAHTCRRTTFTAISDGLFVFSISDDSSRPALNL